MEGDIGRLGICRPVQELQVTGFLQNIAVNQAERVVDGQIFVLVVLCMLHEVLEFSSYRLLWALPTP